MAWDKVCSPRTLGGLGLVNLRLWNEVAFSKLSLHLLKKPQALWSHVLLAKYGCPSTAVDKKGMGSHTWKGFQYSFEHIFPSASMVFVRW